MEVESDILWGAVGGIIFNNILHHMKSKEGGGNLVAFKDLLGPNSIVGFCGGGLGVMLGHQLFGDPLGPFFVMGMSLVGVFVFDKFLTW